MQLRTTILAAIAALPMLAGTAFAHGFWGGPGQGYGYGGGYAPPMQYDWRAEQARRAWQWQRHEAWEHQRYAPQPYYQGGYPGGGYQGGWGPRW